MNTLLEKYVQMKKMRHQMMKLRTWLEMMVMMIQSLNQGMSLNQMIVNELCAKSTLSKEDWVLVKYKGRMFQGIVKKIASEGAEVSVKGKKYRTGLEVAKKKMIQHCIFIKIFWRNCQHLPSASSSLVPAQALKNLTKFKRVI